VDINNNSNNNNKDEKKSYLFPRSSYRGEFTPENLVFNANLQEFAQKIGYICNLETNGKMTSNEAYQQIRVLWKDLKNSMKNLGIDQQ